MIEQHLSLLLVVIPLLAAPLTAMLPESAGCPGYSRSALPGCACCSPAGNLSIVMDGSIISYELGGWAPPWGIEYRIDPMNALVAFIVAAIAAITLPYALRSVEKEIPENRHRCSIPHFCSAWLACWASYRRVMYSTCSCSWKYPRCRPMC